MRARLSVLLALATATLAAQPVAAMSMHCIVAGGDQAAGSATIGLGRFEGDIDPDTLTASPPAQWALGGAFTIFKHLNAHAVRLGRFVLIDVALGGNPYLELVLDRRAPRAWIRGYIFPDGKVRVREWVATCDPSPPDGALPPPPPPLVADGSPAPTTGPGLPSKLPPLELRPWRPRLDPLAPAEIVKTATP
jgi:hypothetical protein